MLRFYKNIKNIGQKFWKKNSVRGKLIETQGNAGKKKH